MPEKSQQKLLLIVMDGIGVRESLWGNAAFPANMPAFNYIKSQGSYASIRAHGKWVGLPSDGDMGNSEVGHNVLGSGQIVDQGAKLVDKALEAKAGNILQAPLFNGQVWKDLVSFTRSKQDSCLHLIGLLSDGGVHSHIKHLKSLIQGAKASGIKKVCVHALLDGRDVPNPSAEKYLQDILSFCQQISSGDFNASLASFGGRMRITMDRYEADWSMVQRGYDLYTKGAAEYEGTDALKILEDLRAKGNNDDQYFPSVCLKNGTGSPVGLVKSGDAAVFFNYRGDRAIEISRAFSDRSLMQNNQYGFLAPKELDIFFAGIMQYDGDEKIPERYLVSPPVIENTLGEYLADLKIRQFACSETQKFGHVTFFWNGNRSGYWNKNLETYVEIPSLEGPFDKVPYMGAFEITAATIQGMANNAFQFGRINFANGDMVGHTGNFLATKTAVSVVDQCLAKIYVAAKENNYKLIITADHGNAEEMFEAPQSGNNASNDRGTGNIGEFNIYNLDYKPKAKTSHSLSEVPFLVWDKQRKYAIKKSQFGLSNIANTVCTLLDVPPMSSSDDSMI